MRPGVLVKDQRGSVLIIAMVLILAMTILGLALFDLAQIEGQMAGTSQTDARALYIAQAGLERGIRELRDGWMADSNAVGGYGTESWADVVNGPTCTPSACDATQYRTMNIANTTVPATGTDPGGAYTLEMKLVLVAEANNPISQGGAFTYPYGQECIPDTGTPTVCANLVFLRSTGTASGPPGFSGTASAQTLVKAWPTSPFAAALTAAGTQFSTNPAIQGDVRVTGTIQVTGTGSSNPAVYLQGGAGDGQRNNYHILDGTYELDRILRRQLICPPQTDCTGGSNLVESLGAELKVYGNVGNTMVQLGTGTDAGRPTDTGNYGGAAGGLRPAGKGRLDGVYVADGCPLPCTGSTFTFGAGASIYVAYNNYTKPYPDRPPKLPLWYQAGGRYPLLNDPARINGVNYPSYSANFFTPNAVVLDNTVLPNGLNCAPVSDCNGDGVTRFGDLFDASGPYNGIGQNMPKFRHSFTFTNKAGNPVTAEICWKRTTIPLANQGGNLPNQAGPSQLYQRQNTLEFGIPTCASPNLPTNPILINVPGPFIVNRLGGLVGQDRIISYRGSAIFLIGTGGPRFEETFVSYCTVSTASPGTQCNGDLFAENHLLVFLTGNLPAQIGLFNGSVNTVMAYIWSNMVISTRRDTNVIGSLRGDALCFHSAATPPCAVAGGGNDPQVFQATPFDLRKIPEELPGGGASGDRWRIDSVPRFYLVCRPGTLPATPTGTCGYQ